MANTLFGKGRFEREMNEELQLHIDLQAQAYIKQGMDPAEARRRAMIEFGGLENVREEARETRTLTWLAGIWRDVRIAVRGLLHEPGFSAVCILMLTLAIGANTTVFSIINATFLRSLPYSEPDRIVKIWEVHANGNRLPVNYLDLGDWKQQQNTFSQIAMCLDQGMTTMRDGKHSARIPCNYVTEGYFDLLDVKPAIGRDFTAKDDAPDAPGVALITSRIWHEQFGAAPDIIGKSVEMDDQMVVIVGVLPENFRHYRDAGFFIPLGPRAETMLMTARSNRRGNTVLGRLAPGADIAAARAQIKGIEATLAKEYPENKAITADMASFQDEMAQNAHERVLFLYGAVALFLLTACVNLANMFLARGMARTREIAIRAALGATRRQIVRQLLIESLVISAIGGAAGICVAWQSSAFAGRLIPWEIRNTLGGSALDLRVCFFALLLTFSTGILFGLAPALRLSHTRPSGALKEDGGAPGRKGRFSGSDVLAIVQVALVAVLLVSSGLLVRSLQRILDAPSGINPDHLITFQISDSSLSNFRTNPNATARFYPNVLEMLKQIPGAENAAFGSSLPYTWYVTTMSIYRDDRPAPEASQVPSFSSHWVGSNFIQTLGIPLLKGRVFDGSEPVFKYPEGEEVALQDFNRLFNDLVFDCVVSRGMAGKVWPGEDPIGKRFHIGPPGLTVGTAVVVGVVGNTLQTGAENGETAEFYLPFQSFPLSQGTFFVVRTHDDPTVMMRTLQDKLGNLLPNSPVFDMHLMEERMSWFVSDRKLTVQMLSAFALASLLLAAAGIYGVLSYITTRRNREIAIRLTLGDTRSGVLFEVLRHGALLLVAGLVIGFTASFFIQKLIQSQLFGVSGTDPVTFLLGAAVLLVVGLVACWVPAWRASKVDPMSTLRAN
jgi:putative ABC transport system permease protein